MSTKLAKIGDVEPSATTIENTPRQWILRDIFQLNSAPVMFATTLPKIVEVQVVRKPLWSLVTLFVAEGCECGIM